jgi:hypothetical protein
VLDDLGREAMAAVAERRHVDILPDTPSAPDPVSVTMPAPAMNRNYLAALGAIVALILVGGGLYGCPQYQVYQQRLTGEAELAGADYNRQVAVREHRPKRTPRAYWPKPKSPALRGWRKRIRSLATACPAMKPICVIFGSTRWKMPRLRLSMYRPKPVYRSSKLAADPDEHSAVQGLPLGGARGKRIRDGVALYSPELEVCTDAPLCHRKNP